MPYFGHTPTNAGSFIEIDDYGSSFNGSTTAFTLQVGGVDVTPNSQNILVMIDGVVQMPTSAYAISGSTITYTEAPPSGADSYVILMGQSASIGQGTIGADELKINGNGTSGQLVKSDGDGTYSYLSTTDITSVGTLSSLTVTGDANFDSNTLFVDASENRVGVGLNNPAKLFHVEGSTSNDFLARIKNTHSTGEGLQIHNNNTNSLFRALDVRNSNGQIFQIYNDGAIVIKGDGSDQTTKWHTGSAYVNAKLDVRQLAIAFSGTDKVTSNTSGNFTFGETLTIGTQQGGKELMTNRARMRHIDGVADANASFSHGDLYVNHISTGNIYMQRATTFASTVQVDDNDLTLKMNNHGSGIRVNVDRKDTNDFAGYEMRTNGSQRWFVGMRELGNDDLQFFNGNSSSGVYQNVLSLNHSNASATFAGSLTVDTGGTSIITADGNNTSGDDGRLILKGHTAGTSRAYAYFNNGVSSGGLNWYVGCLRGSNAFSITCGNDDFPGYGGGSYNDTVISIDGNRKIGIRGNPGSSILSVTGDIYSTSTSQFGSTLVGTVFISSTQYAMIGSNSTSRGIAICRDGSGSFPDFRINGDGTCRINGQLTTGSGIINGGNLYSSASSGSHYCGLSNHRWHTVYGVNSNFSSDQTLKKNIKTSDLGIDFINSLNPVKFNWKKSFQDDTQNHYGFLAQEIVKTALADSVSGDEGEMGMNYSELIAPIVKAIQELSDKITALEGN